MTEPRQRPGDRGHEPDDPPVVAARHEVHPPFTGAGADPLCFVVDGHQQLFGQRDEPLALGDHRAAQVDAAERVDATSDDHTRACGHSQSDFLMISVTTWSSRMTSIWNWSTAL